MDERFCLSCNGRIRGRSDKKFCDDGCRGAYNNKLNCISNKLIREVNITLRKNRRLLERLLGGKRSRHISRDNLLINGFNFSYFTNQHYDKQGQVYFFIYEYGYCPLASEDFLIVKARHRARNGLYR